MIDTSANTSEPIPSHVRQGIMLGREGDTNLTVTVDPARSVNHQEHVHIHWALEQCSVTTTCRAVSTEKPRRDGEEGSTVQASSAGSRERARPSVELIISVASFLPTLGDN